MGTESVNSGLEKDVMSHRTTLFVASCIALIATAMTFAIRGDIMGALEGQFVLSKTHLGWIAGTAFWGFTVSIFVGGQLCDIFGMKRILGCAFIAHLAGCFVTIFATGFWVLFGGTLLIGLANGFVEAAINPLVATIYPNDKTRKLNSLHVWFPGGIVIGGLLGYGLGQIGLGWQIKMAAILVPTLIYGVMFFGLRLPRTERVQSGVSTKAMYREVLRPLFVLWVFCMLLTASTELGPNQWIPNVLSVTAGAAGILVLVWINGLMAVGRLFAGPVVHKLSPLGLLACSALLSAIGLLAMSYSTSAVPAYLSATVFAVGICYFWPTMLGVTSERFPKGGALALGTMGAAGMLSVSIVLPIMGQINDRYTLSALPAAETIAVVQKAADSGVPEAESVLEMLPGKKLSQLPPADVVNALRESGNALVDKATNKPIEIQVDDKTFTVGNVLTPALAKGGAMSFRYVVILPCVLVLVFIAIFLRDRARGGYQIEKLAAEAKEKVEA